ncbi:hypothetical protein [Ferruginibacter profundus]
MIIVALSLSGVAAKGQKFYSYSLNPVCDSLTGYFYLLTGYTIDDKFYRKDNRSNSSYGFFYEKGNVFNGDTLYMPVEKSDEGFINILDSIKAKYTLHTDNTLLFDSLIQKYSKSSSCKIKYTRYKNDGGSFAHVFIKLKMKIVYNQSYLKQQYLDGRYCFIEKGLLTSCTDKDFYFKAILRFEILE